MVKSASLEGLRVLEGSRAVAEAVKLCRAQVISAYPITPQTHIVENLAEIVADGELKAEFVNVESEHSAASVVLGASATGARTYTSTSSQGMALMSEVLYNIAGLRLPVVLSCGNRALSAPLNIWNDQQDSIYVRDSGVIQLYAEDNQEAVDMHIQAYKIAEDHRVLLPLMVCIDGFLLTHTFEPVYLPTQGEVDAFLPAYQPLYYLTPQSPLTMGAFAEPDKYMESRYMIHQAMERAKGIIEEVAQEYGRIFGRYQGGLVEEYQVADADVVLMGMGSMVTTMKVAADEMREQGKKVGVLKLRAYRPFPAEAIRRALRPGVKVAVVEKAISLGGLGITTGDLCSAFYNQTYRPYIRGFIAGLGGRDISPTSLKQIVNRMEAEVEGGELEFIGLNRELLEEG
ncbi:MAG: pyruvate ferredoxin oxidoreductase [Chloroflexi bacterium]|nr:pyruvate ferredoxin oxidoreductase [Chloroflexota bacterium]